MHILFCQIGQTLYLFCFIHDQWRKYQETSWLGNRERLAKDCSCCFALIKNWLSIDRYRLKKYFFLRLKMMIIIDLVWYIMNMEGSCFRSVGRVPIKRLNSKKKFKCHFTCLDFFVVSICIFIFYSCKLVK